MNSPTDYIQSLVCNICWSGPFAQKAFRSLVKGDQVEYKTTWSQVQQSADHGCGLCSLLVEEDELLPEDHKDDVCFLLRLSQIYPTNGIGVHLTPFYTECLHIEIEELEIGTINGGHLLYTSCDDPSAQEITAREPMRDVQSPQCFSLALECLDDCIKNHQKCPKPTLDARLPTRVIDCSDPFHPKLFESQGTYASYVAFSYVWGGPQPNRTTTKNLEIYTSAGIDLDFVPETIQDAIQATNRLGFRYLWVDAFCIIQDSAEDKKTELIQLRRIFRDAHFTIIASCAESASVGFLKTRAPPANPPPRLPFWCKDGRLGIVSTHPMFPYDARDEPANQRAWCLEERLLSARKLVYASDTLHYHCQSNMAPIGGSISFPRYGEKLSDVMFLSDVAISAHVAGWNYHDRRDLQLTWGDIIRNYTTREVTKLEDKLTALAGVAEQYDRVWRLIDSGTNNEKGVRRGYLAGLWKRSLKQDLLWSRCEGEPAPRSSQYLAPSWSWASIHGPVTLTRGTDDRLDAAYLKNQEDPSQIKSCEILSCDVKVEDERLPHGRVKSGMLKIRSKTVPATWVGGNYDSEFGLFVGKGDPQNQPVLMVKPEPEEEQDSSMLCVAEVDIDCTGELEQRLLVVFIMWNTSAEYTHAAGLLITDTDDGKFKRVGFWESTEPVDGTEEDRKEINSWFTTDGSDTMQTLEIV